MNVNRLLWTLLAPALVVLGCGRIASSMDPPADESAFFEPAYQPLARAIRQGTLPAIGAYLEGGLAINHEGKQHMTLLMWAIVNKNKKSLRYLLEKGADPNHQDGQGTQPVGFAAGLDDIDYLRILLDHKGDPNSEDRGEKALITAVMSLFDGHMYLLLDKGADINARKKDGQAPSTIILADLNQFDDVAKFIQRGADINLKTPEYGTLAYAVQDATPNKGTDGYEWQKKVKQMLEQRGVRFPVESPYYDKPIWQPIRQRWYESPEGQVYRTKLDALGRDPEGFGEAYRTLYQAEDNAFETWMSRNNITAPE